MTPLASQSAADALLQWTERHPELASRLIEEIEHASDLISMFPEIGKRIRSSRLPDVRRLRLQRRVPYYLYYLRSDKPTPHLEVLAIWHTDRGLPPPV